MNRRQLGQALSGLVPLAGAAAVAACGFGGTEPVGPGEQEVKRPDAAAVAAPTPSARPGTAPAATSAPEPPAHSQPTAPPLTLETFDPKEIVTVLPRDAIPAIFNPKFMSVAEAQSRKVIQDNEPVLTFSHKGVWRAYSVLQLDAHEIVNDVVGGLSIAVTW